MGRSRKISTETVDVSSVSEDGVVPESSVGAASVAAVTGASVVLAGSSHLPHWQLP